MSDQTMPKLNPRSSRETDTREKTTRRKPWAPPSRLDAPAPPPGYKHRWIRSEVAGQEDRINVAGKLREGYELVRSEEYPEFASPSVDDGRHAGVLGVGGLLLARVQRSLCKSEMRIMHHAPMTNFNLWIMSC